MYPLVESVCIKNGRILNIGYHQKRYQKTCRNFLHSSPVFDLKDCIEPEIQPEFFQGTVKCRFLYDESHYRIEFVHYIKKTIRALKIVRDENISYAYKTTDRSRIRTLFERRGSCDDILIVRNGLITDLSSANILFFDGDTWLTPEKPLLEGTARQRLIDQKIIQTAEIKESVIDSYQKWMSINAMLDFSEERIQDVSGIVE